LNGGDQEISFLNLKDAVKSAPELQLADPAKPYIVTYDARDVETCAVLEQESDNGPHPVAFASRSSPEPKTIILCTSKNCLLWYS
jgi:hypothetical protein